MDCGCDGVTEKKFNLGHMALLLIAVSIAIRLILSPILTYDFDVYHWALTIGGFQSGNGLYDVAGYYYTPVWGYILGFLSIIQDALFNLDAFGWKITGLIPMEQLIAPYHISIVTTIPFNVFMKITLILCDVLVAVLLYWLVKKFTDDERKALVGMALWLFCPLVVYMSGVQVQFDTFSALFFLVTVILLLKDRYLLAGMMVSIAILLKFFPAFCILVLVGYVLAKNRDNGTAIPKLMKSVIGAGVMALIIMLPQILDGTVMDAFSFIFGRASAPTNVFMQIQSILGSALGLIGMVAFGVRMARCKENHDWMLFQNITFALSFSMLTSLTPQYIIVMIPFLVVAMCQDSRLKIGVIIASVGAFFAASTYNNMSLLMSFSAYTGIVSEQTVVSLAQYLESHVLFGADLISIFNTIGWYTEFIGLLIIVGIALNSLIISKTDILDRLLNKIFRGQGNEI